MCKMGCLQLLFKLVQIVEIAGLSIAVIDASILMQFQVTAENALVLRDVCMTPTMTKISVIYSNCLSSNVGTACWT
jgi:hypothetical protein